MRLREFLIRNPELTGEYVKYIDENNWGLAFQDRETALKLFNRFLNDNFHAIPNFEYCKETGYWHITLGSI